METGLTRRELLGAIGTAAATAAVSDGVGAQQRVAGDWPTFGYDRARSGHNPDGTGPREDVGGAWQFTGADGGIVAGSAVVDGVVYTTSTDGHLYAVDASSGDELDDWPVELGAGSAAVPTVDGETVYVGDDSGVVWALDRNTGGTRWRFETEGAVEGAPVVHDGVVYATSADGFVYAIDAETGTETAWETFDTGEEIDDDVEIRGGPAVTAAEDGTTIYVANTGGIVYALDGETGTREWREVVDRGQIQSAPAVVDGVVYVSTVEGTSGFVYALETATGDQLWEFEADGPVISTPAVADDRVYVGGRSQHVYAIDAGSGDESWRFDTGRQVNSSPTVVDGTVYVSSFSDELFGLTTDGDERWAAETGGSVSASPAVAGGRVYVGSENGTLYALEEGGDLAFEPGAGDDEAVTDSPLEDDDAVPFAFLILPAAVVTFFGLLAAGVYVVLRSEWAEQFTVDEAPVEALYDDEDESIPDYDDRSETEVWSMIVNDVIERADEQRKVATENVIVSKHVDDTLESPVTAYRIESARDDRARVTVTEPLLGEQSRDSLSDQPLNEGWTVEAERLTFETTVDPGETVTTMVGRADTPEDELDTLLEKPDVEVVTIEDEEDDE